MKSKGFTVMEFLIVAAIIAICASVLVPSCQSTEARRKTQESGYNTLCINGYQFVSNRWSTDKAVQVIDAEGRGIPCRQ